MPDLTCRSAGSLPSRPAARAGRCVLLAAPLFLTGIASAQETSAPAKEEEIVIVAEPGDRQRIDRKVYTVSDTAQTQTENALDVLRRVPAITVSATDAIRLAGDAGPTILIDGQPRKDGAATLKNLQASQVARIEVMTNPSAAFSAEGTAGVINIVTRRSYASGLAGSAVASGDSKGYTEFKLMPTVTRGPWSIATTFALRQDHYRQRNARDRDSIDDRLDYRQTGREGGDFDDVKAGVQLNYKSSASRSFGLSVDYADSDSETVSLTRTISGASALVPDEGYDDLRSAGHDLVVVADYGWTGKEHGESLSISASRSRTVDFRSRTLIDSYSGDAQQIAIADNIGIGLTKLKLDYVHPMPKSDLLSLGGSAEFRTGARTDALTTLSGSAALAPTPDYRSFLSSDTRTIAGYATFQFPIGHWTLLPGLRLEDRRLDFALTGGAGRRHELIPFPSFHLTHAFGKRVTLDASYSKRVSWPLATQLDPVIRYSDRLTGNSGNPALRPQITHSFAASLDYTPGKQALNLTGYARDTIRAWSTAVRLTPEGVSVTQPVNSVTERKVGGELSARGPIWKGWRYSVSADLADRRFDLLDLGTHARGEEFSYSGNAQLEYQQGKQGPPGANGLQFEIEYAGPTRELQSRNSGFVFAAFTLTHPFTRRLVGVIRVADLFASQTQVSRLYGSDFIQTTREYDSGQRLKLSLTYRLGAAK